MPLAEPVQAGLGLNQQGLRLDPNPLLRQGDPSMMLNAIAERRSVQPNLFQQAQQQYPMLKGLDLQYKESFGKGKGFLEYWPAKEIGSPEYPRPKEFPLGKHGLEVYDPKTRPIDIMGDVASHFLIHDDPKMASYFDEFKQSLTPEQQGRLKEQYQYAKQSEGEKRPYEQWLESSGLPGYFRGYAFQQWDNAKELYTPDQIKMFDSMVQYLQTPSKDAATGEPQSPAGK